MRKLILLSTLLTPAAAFAGGYVIPQVNARDLALASAATADQTGPEALFLNVAELAGLDGFNVSLSGEILANRTTWSEPNLGSSSLVPQYNTPPSGAISYGHHINHDMAFGIGVGVDVPAGGSLVWPNGWQGQEAIQTVKQQVFRLAAGVGFQPVPFVKIGASYVRYQATEELHQSLNFLDHEGDGGIALNGGADAFDIGIGVHIPNIPLSLGANYGSTGELNLNGDAHFTNVPPAFTTLLHDQKAHEDLKIPNTFSVGAAYAVQPNITLMAAYSWEGWKVYHSDTFVGSDGFTVSVPRNYRNAHVYRAGGEWVLSGLPALTLRGGVLRSVSSQSKDTLSPSLTDGNSWAVSLGAGFNVTPKFRIDFGYQHAWFDLVTATGPDAFPGTYDTHVDIFSLGITYRGDLGIQPTAGVPQATWMATHPVTDAPPATSTTTGGY